MCLSRDHREKVGVTNVMDIAVPATVVLQPSGHAAPTEHPTMSLVALVAIVLKRCKEDVLAYLSTLGMTTVTTHSIRWCLTVPAIWDPQVRQARCCGAERGPTGSGCMRAAPSPPSQAKLLMREAAVRAGA